MYTSAKSEDKSSNQTELDRRIRNPSTYDLYGLAVNCDFELPELVFLPESFESSDRETVKILRGPVTSELEDGKNSGSVGIQSYRVFV